MKSTSDTERAICMCDECDRQWETDKFDPEKAVAAHNQVAHDREPIAEVRYVDAATDQGGDDA